LQTATGVALVDVEHEVEVDALVVEARQDALEASPMLVKRLRRLRDARTSARTTR
jgi:hypothetical protein